MPLLLGGSCCGEAQARWTAARVQRVWEVVQDNNIQKGGLICSLPHSTGAAAESSGRHWTGFGAEESHGTSWGEVGGSLAAFEQILVGLMQVKLYIACGLFGYSAAEISSAKSLM